VVLKQSATFLFLAVINENNMRVYSGNRNEDSSIVAGNMKLVAGGWGGGGYKSVVRCCARHFFAVENSMF
jgi:hypothetical protein